MSWLRWWEGTVTDPKWRVIAARSKRPVGDVIAVWAFLLEEARRNDGALPELDYEIIGACLGYEPEHVEAIIDGMRAKNSVSDDGITNWRKRQPKREDDSRARVAEWREKQRANAACNAPVTRGNAPEAEAEAEADISSSLRSDDRRTRPVSPPKASKPSTTQAAPPTPLPPDLIRDWQAVRKAKRAGPLSQTAWDGIAREAAKAGVTLETAVRTCVERGWQSFRADWLADKRETRAPPRQGGNGFVSVLRDLQGAFDDIATDRYDDVFAVDFDEIGQDRGHAGTGRGQPSNVLDLTAFDRR